MSRAVDLFIDSDLELAALAARVAEITGFQLREEAEGWRVVDDGFEALLGPHPFADDFDLLLSRYRYVLGTRVAEGARLQDAPATIMLRLVADQLQRKAGMSVLLVLDLQYRDHPSAGSQVAPSEAPAPPSPSAPPGSEAPRSLTGSVAANPT